MTDTAKIQPPWDVITVNHLNAYQWRSGMHPFTCGNDSSHVLVTTCDGWLCPMDGCDWTQDWAHAFMADPTTWPNITVSVSGVPPQQLYEAIQRGAHHLSTTNYLGGEDDNEETVG